MNNNRGGAVQHHKVAHITTVDMSLRYLLLNQLCYIQQAGYEAIGISADGPDVPRLEDAGIRHIAVPMTRSLTPFADLVALLRLYRVMRRERFSIVHTHTPKPGLLGQLAARLAGVPIVINTLHGFYFHEHMHPLKRRFYIATEKIAARCSDVILSQNGEDIQTAIREGICAPHQIKRLGNGIDVRRFDRSTVDDHLLARKRDEIGLSSDAPVVGFVGRLVEEKGILELLQAARLVLQQKPETRFLIIGPIDHEKSDALTPAVAHEYGVAQACIFTDKRDDMPDLYAMMDIFVLPSYREGFPRSPMEASSMGIPSIVTDIRGCREAVKHDHNGLLVPPRDATALATAILSLLDDPEHTRRLGTTARQMALESFDEQKVFARVTREYSRLLQEKGLQTPSLTEETMESMEILS